MKVSASDSDGFYNISTYTIIHGNEQNNFTINTTSGEIKTATPLDREVKDQFILTVRAQDSEYIYYFFIGWWIKDIIKAGFHSG